MAEEKNEISLIVEKSKSCQTLPVTGAWGGPAPDATNIIAHFFVESPAVPNVITIKADEMGKYDPNKGESIGRGDYAREIQATFVMAPQTAINIGKWLIDNANMLMQQGNGDMFSD